MSAYNDLSYDKRLLLLCCGRTGGSMSDQNEPQCNCRELLADQETWEIILDPAFCNDPGAADCLAHLLFILKKAIASGPEGCIRGNYILD